jgi:hypothetical protein
MKYLALVLYVLATSLAFAQDTIKHATTVEQCRADASLWWNALDGPRDKSFAEIHAMGMGMIDCNSAIDHSAPLEWQIKYDAALLTITTRKWTRMRDFLQRHNLMQQFLREDAEAVAHGGTK